MKKNKIIRFSLVGVLLAILCFSLFALLKPNSQQSSSQMLRNEDIKKISSQKRNKKLQLPAVSSKDWNLILVNRDHKHEELSPDVVPVENIYLDKRITKQATQFLEAARAIDSREHLISGYRSVAYQEKLFNSYVTQEMTSNPNLTRGQAEKLVKTYSQPAGASEHQTGLAMDMSTVDSLNESDPRVVSQLKKIAPQYGFVLRFPDGKTAETGVGYEDWHYRYVGVESAKYMAKHHLTLEEYITLLKENNQ
ncbi:TPA: M15 family metallopeptidase [Streptococcus agalactiae]